jgi:hypothetical protein
MLISSYKIYKARPSCQNKIFLVAGEDDTNKQKKLKIKE